MLGTSDLALKHRELLTKQGILQHELRLAAGEIQSSVRDSAMILGPCPIPEAL